MTDITEALSSSSKNGDQQDQHIVIVGGGMVGVSLALLLSKWISTLAAKPVLKNKKPVRYSITLIEKFSLNATSETLLSQPSFDARSTAVSAGSAKIFGKLGCWQTLKKVAEPIKTIHVSDKGHIANVNINARDYSQDAVGYVVENRHLGAVLLNELEQSSVNCLAPAKVTSCVPKKNGYSLTIINDEGGNESNGSITEHIHADLFIVADGAQSELRKQLGIDTQNTDYKQSALIANVALAQAHKNIAYERFTDTGPIALLPLSASHIKTQPSMSKNRAALVWIIPQDQQNNYLNESDEALLARLQDRFGYRAGQFLSIGERQAYPLTLVQSQEQVRSNLVVIGNAAHYLHPVAGQGFNLALRDCNQLVSCLQRADEDNKMLGELSVLKQYVDEQLFDQNSTIKVTDSLVKIFSSDRLSNAVMRQLGLLSLSGSTSTKHIFAKKMMGLS